MTAETAARGSDGRALRELVRAGRPLSKGELAQGVFGEVTGSTQAMMTRITQRLRDAGWVEERAEGRLRMVAITEPGMKAVPALEPSLGVDRDMLWQLESSNGVPTRYSPPTARNIKHLHGSAVLAARSLAERMAWSVGDDRFAGALLLFIDEGVDEKANALSDLTQVRSLVTDWPRVDLSRGALVEVLARIENPDERATKVKELAGELLRLSGYAIASGETALLWTAGAGSLLGGVSAPLRTALVERLRDGLRRSEELHRPMARYWRARCLVAMGAHQAARLDWPRLQQSLSGNASERPLEAAARRVERGVEASGEVNVALGALDDLESEILVPALEKRMGRSLPKRADEVIDAVFADVDGVSEVWHEVRTRQRAEDASFETASEDVQNLPGRLPADVSARAVAEEHAFRAGNVDVAPPAPLADGDLKLRLRVEVRDNLWSPAMVLGYVAALHRQNLIYRNPLS